MSRTPEKRNSVWRGIEKRRTLNRECGDRKESEREQENLGNGRKE